MRYRTQSAAQTQQLARQFVEELLRSLPKQGTATVVGLSGELGAGKTTFMKGVARHLGITEEITSPTFVIQKIYEIPARLIPEGEEAPCQRFQRLVHLDAYRLSSGEELAAIGWHDTLTDPANLVFIEWPEMVESVLPLRARRIVFEAPEGGDPDERRITIEGEEGEGAREA